jgi:hypothetical protein
MIADVSSILPALPKLNLGDFPPLSSLLRFEVRELYLEGMGRYFLPLPKLSAAQLEFLAGHLRERGFSVIAGTRIHARKGPSRISIDGVGLAWSSEGLLDAIAPAVPELLRFAKEPASTNPYLDAKEVRGGFAVRLVTRMESSSLWASLRGSGQCGLTPDEGLVVRELLRDVDGELECVTDYPTEGCSAFHIGRRVYFRSTVSTAEFAANLRTLPSVSQKSCYLPKQSVLMIRTGSQALGRSSKGLGEWCFLDLSENL